MSDARSAAREAVYAPTSSVGSGVAVRCVCWHRSSGDHAADCPAADTGDLLPPWRDVTETHREYRGTDATGRLLFAEVSSVVKRPPVERAAVVAERSVEPAPIIASGDEFVAVVDTETTGLRPEARICEIAFAVVDLATGQVLHRAAQLIHPGCAIPAAATNVHGITDAMVAASPRLADVWPRVAAFVARHVPSLDVIAHNAPFDRGVLTTCALMAELRKRAGKPFAEWAGDAHVWGVGVERANSPAKAPSKTPKKTPQKPGAQKSDSTSRPDLFTLGVTA